MRALGEGKSRYLHQLLKGTQPRQVTKGRRAHIECYERTTVVGKQNRMELAGVGVVLIYVTT